MEAIKNFFEKKTGKIKLKDKQKGKKKCTHDHEDKGYSVYVHSPERNQNLEFPENNRIRTSRYTALSFIPKNLYEQFRRAANCYFLLIACLQMIPGVSPVNKFTTILPLIFVLTVTAIKEGIEDYKRRKSDSMVNHQYTRVLRNDKWERITWEEIVIGDTVKVKKGQGFPADLVLISTSQKGTCYIDTQSLDGETNLKLRQALPETAHINKRDVLNAFQAKIDVEAPNNLISEFKGALAVSEKDKPLPLSYKQLLLRGCVLRNTEWCVGIAVYIGDQTKLMQNSTEAPSKRSTLEKNMNRVLITIFAIMLGMCIFCTIGSIIWNKLHWREDWYLGFSSASYGESTLNFFSYLITFSAMIPISLYVTLEVVRVLQAMFINWDLEMYDESSDLPAKARTSNLSEELGQVKYIFSDKTGTLTRNQMELLEVAVGDHSYSLKEEKDQIIQDCKGKDSDLFEFFRALSVCHTVIIEPPGEVDETEHEHEREPHHLPILEKLHILSPHHSHNNSVNSDNHPHPHHSHHKKPDDGEIRYQAASPDEDALVSAAKNLGFVFTERAQNDIEVDLLGDKQRFELLNVLEFDSNRKRMSVIVKDKDGKIILFCKGADSAILPKLGRDSKADTEKVENCLNEFATKGLRTLCVAKRELDESTYSVWSEKYQSANANVQEREKAVSELSEEIENELTLLGVTGIEDKLQEGVPEAIAALKSANINVWVLTGDKKETAINIGFSTKLLNEDMDLIELSGHDESSVQQELEEAFQNIAEDDDPKKRALIIEGITLTFLLEDLNQRFLELAKTCSSVICVRATPLQKASLVELVRENLGEVTLAIGDGANDVSMIRAAHVGVGISGMEGNQAQMASDYTISQFRFLYRLLILHGRWSYIRNSTVVKYCFYKNATFALTSFWYAMYSGFSAQTLYDGWSIAIFNVAFTGFPIIALGILEQDVSGDVLFHQPMLYRTGQRGEHFNLKSCVSWFASSVWHSLCIFFITVYTVGTGVIDDDGDILGLIALGLYCYTLVILVLNFRLALEIRYWTKINHLMLWGAIAFWFVWISLYSNFANLPIFRNFESEMYWVGFKVMSTPLYWAVMFAVTVLALIPDFSAKFFRQYLWPHEVHIIKEKLFLSSKVLEEGQAPPEISEADYLLPIKPETARLTTNLPSPLLASKKILERRPSIRYTGYAFSQEAGDLNALQARYGVVKDANKQQQGSSSR